MALRGEGGEARRMRRARSIWAELIRQYERSGKELEQWAAERKIPPKTLRWWMWRLRREQAEEVSLVPVRVVASTAPTARRPEEESAVIEAVLTDGVRLRFPVGVSSEAVAELIARLR
jgi:hypothetical protein